MPSKRSASSTWLWAAALQFVLANLGIFLLASIRTDASVSPDLQVGGALCVALLSAGWGLSLLVGLSLRLTQPGATRDDQPGRAGATARIDRPLAATVEVPTAAPAGPPATAPAGPSSATSEIPTPEEDYRFWINALIAGLVAWPLSLLALGLSGALEATADWCGYLLLALHLFALPIALTCLVVADRRSETNRLQSIKILKIPFYYGFASIGLWFLGYIWSNREMLEYGRM